ncbi:MAG TPA: GGDEF domain-containing protein [Terracidiphilus sp.]|nr:GGDEF domain-containing protein [Terracidiphilus sp.]
MDWSKLPDLAAVMLLACAFAAVARRNQAPVSTLWLTGWLMIALHFAAFIFAPVPGQIGILAVFVGLTALAWAGLLFNWAAVPYRKQRSSLWMLSVMIGTTTLYIGLVVFSPAASWALTSAAVLFGTLTFTVAIVHARKENYSLRWATVVFYCALSVFLLAFQHRPGNGMALALNGVLFTVYFGCCVHFWFAYRWATTGAFITIAGFLAWAAVFVVTPGMNAFIPNVRLESEVWDLPKYVVAVGMILLLLEDQIEHNKYLALHDELTGLPNRRLFQDRLASALERARRNGSNTALLLVDLDQFKQVNDALGHHVGDQLLERVGRVFSGRVRRSDTVARTGGDEFSVILDDPTCREDAERVGNSLIELLNEPFDLGTQTARIGASIGIAVFPEDASDAEGLCIAADLRMYAYKHRIALLAQAARPPMSASFPPIEAPARSRQAG